jgi:hypothetical protein
MQNPRRQTRIAVIWECVPDADPKALDKAFAMLFRRGPYASDRGNSAETCGEPPELDKPH